MHPDIGPQNIVQKRGAFGRFRKTIVPYREQFARFRKDIARYRALSCESEPTVEKPHPNPEMVLPISLDLYQQLMSASISSGFQKATWEIGAAAIREWIIRNNPESFAMPSTSGYQWKHLFLPNGTLLRTIFNGKNFHCLVEGDQVRYDGKIVSPSGFANAVGGVRRNAWQVIWILFPNSSSWKLAGALRTKKNSRRSSRGNTERG